MGSGALAVPSFGPGRRPERGAPRWCGARTLIRTGNTRAARRPGRRCRTVTERGGARGTGSRARASRGGHAAVARRAFCGRWPGAGRRAGRGCRSAGGATPGACAAFVGSRRATGAGLVRCASAEARARRGVGRRRRASGVRRAVRTRLSDTGGETRGRSSASRLGRTACRAYAVLRHRRRGPAGRGSRALPGPPAAVPRDACAYRCHTVPVMSGTVPGRTGNAAPPARDPCPQAGGPGARRPGAWAGAQDGRGVRRGRKRATARFAADAASLRCGVPRGRVGRAEGEGARDEFRRTCS
ncbi:hypothetical protein STENM223S_07675 [Streptomyces tendae]